MRLLLLIFSALALVSAKRDYVFSNPFSDLWWLDHWQPPTCNPQTGLLSHNQAQFFQCGTLSGNATFFFEEAIEDFPYLWMFACSIKAHIYSYDVGSCARLSAKTHCIIGDNGLLLFKTPPENFPPI